jgi:hypothetical protein
MQEIERYFDYYWNNNQAATVGEKFSNIVIQLEDTQMHSLYCNFLYFEFRKVFRKFLMVPNYFTSKRYQYFSWDDYSYQRFMDIIFNHLEPIEIQANELIFEELEEVNQAYFFLKGTFKVGFKINDQTYYPLIFQN